MVCAAVLFGIRRIMRKVYVFSMEEGSFMLPAENENLEDVWNDRAQENKWLRALDEERRNKVLKCRNPKDRVRSLAAGLLLQYAVSQWEAEAKQEQPECPREKDVSDTAGREVCFSKCSWADVTTEELWEELLVKQKGGRQLHYDYNLQGKPFLKGIPLYFSLSHSGNYVLCGVSEAEIGVDIQEERIVDFRKISQRFFTEEERRILEACSENCDSEGEVGKREGEEAPRKLFYRLWTQKEAYGKLTGGGLHESIGVSPVLEAKELGICMAEYEAIDGYCAAACWRISCGDKK